MKFAAKRGNSPNRSEETADTDKKLIDLMEQHQVLHKQSLKYFVDTGGGGGGLSTPHYPLSIYECVTFGRDKYFLYDFIFWREFKFLDGIWHFWREFT